jgi:hypothetical protein
MARRPWTFGALAPRFPPSPVALIARFGGVSAALLNRPGRFAAEAPSPHSGVPERGQT